MHDPPVAPLARQSAQPHYMMMTIRVRSQVRTQTGSLSAQIRAWGRPAGWPGCHGHGRELNQKVASFSDSESTGVAREPSSELSDILII